MSVERKFKTQQLVKINNTCNIELDDKMGVVLGLSFVDSNGFGHYIVDFGMLLSTGDMAVVIEETKLREVIVAPLN